MTDPAEERFMPINDLYEISNLANIRTRDTHIYKAANYNLTTGYSKFYCALPGERAQNQYIHRLVAIAFNLPRAE